MTRPSRTILIVDDSPEDREVYRRYLERDTEYSYTLLEAAVGQDGLKLWEIHQPDAILLDYRLPDLDGLEFLAQLERSPRPQSLYEPQERSFPVIMVTGEGSEAIAVQAMKAGAQDYLIKGRITLAGLQIAVNSVISAVQLRTQLQQRISRERLVSEITRKVHESLDLDDVLQTTVKEVLQFLQTDRVLLFRLYHNGQGEVVTEAANPPWSILLSETYYDPCLREEHLHPFRQGKVAIRPDIFDGTVNACHVNLLKRLQVRANLVVPILQNGQLWGMLMAHHCSGIRQWQTIEVELLKDIATQVGIALQQAELYQQAQSELAERRRVEAELRESEERLRLALDGSSGGLWDWNIETNEDYLSPRWLEMLEYEPGNLPAHYDSWSELIHPEDREWVTGQLEAHLKDESVPYRFEYRMLTKSGQWKWIANYGRVVKRDEQGRPLRMAGIHHDIDDAKRADLKLQETHIQLEAALSAGSIYTWCWDMVSNRVTTDRSSAELFGVNPESAATGLPIEIYLEAIHPSDRRHVAAAIERAVKHKEPFVAEYRLRGADGHERWVISRGRVEYDANGTAFALPGAIADITERKQAEEALRQSEERLRLAQRAAGAGLWDWDLMTNQITWSDEYYQLHGLNTSIPPSYENWLTSILQPDRDRVNQAILDALENNTGLAIEFRILHPASGVCWLTIMGQTLYNTDGHPVRMTGISLNITERKQAEEALSYRAQELTRLNHVLKTITADLDQRNRDLNQFTYVVSHDLKAPLRGIQNLSQWLQEDLGDLIPPENQKQLKLMASRVTLMETLISDLLQYSRAGRVKQPPEQVNLGELLTEIVSTLTVPLGITVRFTLPLPTVWARRVMLSQVFANLISNAIKYGCIDGRGEITISAWEEDNSYRFAVADNGPGIAPEDQERIFGIFETLQAKTPSPSESNATISTGIGLAIVKRLVNAEGGNLWIESDLNRGATFFFTWKQAESQVAQHRIRDAMVTALD
ncbi:MAG: PAS domain-containing protein [Elainellaceae cyanobacterium]